MIEKFEIEQFENLSRELVVMMKSFNLNNRDNAIIFKKKLDKLENLIEDYIYVSPEVLLSDLKREVYEALPYRFTVNEELDAAIGKGMSEKKFRRFIESTELFEKNSDGSYKKKLASPF